MAGLDMAGRVLDLKFATLANRVAARTAECQHHQVRTRPNTCTTLRLTLEGALGAEP